MNTPPVTLEGLRVKLVPLSPDHLDQLCEVGFDESQWKWTSSTIHTRDEMAAYINSALSQQQSGTGIPFATMTDISFTDGNFHAVGSTRFFNIDHTHKRVEIGHTWIAPPWQRTPVNTEAKYLMLRYAFEALGCIRVEFKTDVLNAQSRAAIERLGARQEGIFRKHMIYASGRIRDSVYYSIVDEEWPIVKKMLEKKLTRNIE